MFINLIANAIKYNVSASPLVTVSSARRQGVYEVRVEDNGPGIAERDRERIFARFERGPSMGTHGVGLGLAISRQIAENFGGSLELDTGRSAGAAFIVRLPLVDR